MTFTKDTRIGELLRNEPRAAVILMQNGMHCVGCPSSVMETLEQASAVHGMNCNAILEEINSLPPQEA